MNEEIKEKTETLQPFTKLCMTIGQLPASYVETMSYYEMLVWFVHYLRDDIIPVVNANGEATQELQKLYVELQSYVNNYFDNLDVQEEINNKLDEMADSGQLADIIAKYLGLAGMITFDTVADMKMAKNLVNGSKCCTLGYHNVNDEGNAFYKVRTITNDDVIDEMFIIKLYDNSLIAELIIENDLNVKQLGVYGDNVHDETTKLRSIIKKLYDMENQVSWRKIKKLYFPKGTYKINNTLIDSSLNVSGLQLKIVGNDKENTIISTTSNVLFDNHQIFGFSCFENLSFIGNNNNKFMNYVGGTPGNAQNMRFNQCRFREFKTILNTSGNTMTSEVTFFECSISSCGTDENTCDLFILDNSQAVNWRFIATDIESFKGILFNYKKGAMITWFQGSCIPLGNSIVINGSEASYDYFGDGNSPTLVMNEVKFEMRDNACLLHKGDSNANLKLIFNGCGMGGANIPVSTTTKKINLGSGGNKLYFNNCYGLLNYSISTNTNLTNFTDTADLIEFTNCANLNTTKIQELISNSNFVYTGTNTGFLCKIIVDGITYRPTSSVYQYVKDMKFNDVIIQSSTSDLGFMIRGNTADNVQERTYYINNYISHIKVRNLSKGTYGGSTKFTLNFYDDNNTLLGTVEEPIQSNKYNEIFVNKYIGTLKMTSTSNYSGAIAIYDTIIVSVERL